jgi:PAS domain S-box-containing protein
MRPRKRRSLGDKAVTHHSSELDWSGTSLGPPEQWPQSLHAAVHLCLESPALVSIFWGSEFIFIYSEAWRRLIGDAHPQAFGHPAPSTFEGAWPHMAVACQQVLTTGAPAVLEAQPFHTHQQPLSCLYFDHSLSPLRDDDDEVCGIFTVSTKSAGPEQHVEEVRFSTLLTAAAAGIVETDAKGAFTYVNDRYCEIVGRSREELIGRMTLLEVTYPDDVLENQSLLDSMMETGEPFNIEQRCLRPDGTIVWVNTFVSWVGSPCQDHGRWVAACIDISHRKKAEDAVRERDERKSFLLQLGDRLRPLYDPLSVMDAAARMLGEYLGANRVTYGEISSDGAVMTGRDYVNGVESLPRRFYLREAVPTVLEYFLQDRIFVATDVHEDPTMTEASLQVMDAVAVRAHVSVPLKKNGRLVAALGVHQSCARQWTATEISLIEETAERTWAAVEQARAEAALRSSEARLSAIFAQAAVGISEISLHGRFMNVNHELCRLLGRSPDTLAGMNVADIAHPEDSKKGLTFLAELVRTGTPGTVEMRCLRPDGEVIHISSAVSRLDDERGRPRAILAVTADLTERQKSQALLAEELEDNKRLQQVSTRLIPRDDPQRLFKELVAAAADILRADMGVIQLFDGAKQQLQTLAIQNICERDLHVLAQPVQKAGSPVNHVIQRQERVVVRDFATDTAFADTAVAQQHLKARARAMQATPLVSRGGQLLGVISTYWTRAQAPDERQLRLLDILARQAADLLERHQSEAALRNSEERYRSLFNSIDEGFCVVEVFFNDDGKALDYSHLEVNPAFEKHTGLTNVLGQRMRELVPDMEEYWFETYGRVALTGEPKRFVDEARGLGNRWYDVYAFRFGEPESHRVAILFSDITDRIHNEAELKQADRRKNEFLAMLAHELRNPLAPIRTGIEVLRLAQGQRTTTEHMLELMERQMQQMVRLVDDLLDISRITQGKLQIRRQTCQLQIVLNSAIESSRPFIGASGVDLVVNTLPESVELHADPARLAQVFSNLLNNAAKYTDAGGRIWLDVIQDDGELVISVKDTGTGIPQHMLKTVFNPFTQVDNALDRSHGGLGVGLSLVKTLVELHGGSVFARSPGLGKGSEFVVRLPHIVTTPETGVTPIGAGLLENSKALRVLVVDDNTDAAQTLGLMLEIMGHDVRVAHGGRAGLALAETFRPQLMLLDLGMPELDGYETARLIRSRSWGGGIVIAALTGWGQDEDRRRSREAGFDHHLVKPIERETLVNVLREASEQVRTTEPVGSVVC